MRNSVTLSGETVTSWSVVKGYEVPGGLNTQCPYCGAWCYFGFSPQHFDGQQRIYSHRSVCPSCRKRPTFIALYDFSDNALSDKKPSEILMHPGPELSFAIPNLPDTVPEPIRRSMEDTVRAFNARIYGSTATSGRRTLEGIFKYLLAEEKRNQPLHKLITSAKDEVDFVQPLTRLADAIRAGGNIGAHFDMQREVDAASARRIVELLHYLISYLYVLPEQIKDLEDSFEQ